MQFIVAHLIILLGGRATLISWKLLINIQKVRVSNPYIFLFHPIQANGCGWMLLYNSI